MRKFLLVSAASGFVLFIIGAFSRRTDFFSQIELLMFFGVAVVMPLSLVNLYHYPDETLYKIAVGLQPLVMLGVGASLFVPTGIGAGVLASGWLLLTGIIALLGLQRWLPRWQVPLNEFCLIVGMLYAPISGIWFVAYCMWGAFLGFDTTITLLTGVHFCFISLGGLVIAGLLGRIVTGLVYHAAAVGAIVSPALVAVGITLTNMMAGVSVIEVASVVLLAASFLLLSGITVVVAPRRIEHPVGKWLITVSALSLLVTMGFALAYSIGHYTGWWGVEIPRMVQWHGWFNAIGFVGLGLLGWVLAASDFLRIK